MVTVFVLWQTRPSLTDKLGVRNMVRMDLQNLHKIQHFFYTKGFHFEKLEIIFSF